MPMLPDSSPTMTTPRAWIALDTETTGLNPRADRLVELAAVKFDPETGQVQDTFHRYLNPGVAVGEEALAVHGLTNEKLASCPSFAQVLPEFLEFVDQSVTIAHNASFDVGFLDTEMGRVKAGKFADKVLEVVDTLAISRMLYRSKSHTLDTLCDRFQVDRSTRTLHGALVDCELLAAVYAPLSQEYETMLAQVNLLVPGGIGQTLPAPVDELVAHSLSLAELIGMLERERKRANDAIRAQLNGQGSEGEGWRVRFTPQKRTDWARIQAKFLAEVDISPFIKETAPAMYVERV